MSAQQILERADRSAAKVQKQQRQGQIKFVKEQVSKATNSHHVQSIYDFVRKVCVERVPASVAEAQAALNVEGGNGGGGTDGRPGSSNDAAPGPGAIVPVRPGANVPDGLTADEREHKMVMEKEIIRQYTCIKDAPIGDLKHVLMQVEPVTFAKHALAGLRSQHGKEVTRTALMEVLEYISGSVTPESKLSGVFSTYGDLAQHVARLHIERGRPSLELSLTLPWGQKGVYNIRVESDGVLVAQKFLKTVVLLTPDDLTDRGYSIDFQADPLYIDFNFSERRATLCQEHTAGSLPLVALFGAKKRAGGAVDGPVPGAQRRRLLAAAAAPAALPPIPNDDQEAAQVADSEPAAPAEDVGAEQAPDEGNDSSEEDIPEPVENEG
mmetsp:Transcript_13124/g.30661  ORF Transcript_13124/g.30661 Transcript_13124/m.30661 type:complete len:381 (+) Transcript_13124:66-1208(+)